MSRILEFLLLFLVQTEIRSDELSPFSPANIAVYFNPAVSVKDEAVVAAYSVNELISMISKISTRFGKVNAPMVHKDSAHTNQLISTAIARFNIDHTSNDHKPMEVVQPFPMSGLKNETTTNFDIAKHLADNANAIYPGTVKWLYLYCHNLSGGTVMDVKNHLIYIQSQLSGTKYKLGIILPHTHCSFDWFKLPNHLVEILPYLEGIIFISYPVKVSHTNRATAIEDPRSASVFVTNGFQRCMKKVQNYNKNISMQLQTGWKRYSNKTNISAHDNKLVEYWMRINDWAKLCNVSVVFDRAFDTPSGSISWAHRGWWKLIENSSYTDPSQYVYMEKQYPIQPLEVEMHSSKEEMQSQVWPIAVGVAVGLVVFVMLLVASLLWKPLSHKIASCCLKNEDVNEFFNGVSETPIGEEKLIMKEIQSVPYQQDLELAKSQFTVDMNILLGGGTFGAVYQGSVKHTSNRDLDIKVAVKTTQPSSPSSAIKGMMSEIKVLSYLGKHDNIVNIEGAYTKGIKKGKLYIFLELCELGSLESYLRENPIVECSDDETRDAIELNDIEQNFLGYTELNPSKLKAPDDDTAQDIHDKTIAVEGCINHESTKHTKLNVADLRRWSFEIANGMQFLASRNVVHADLATRNILLTHNKRAKISDFGLSRRLYEYAMYVKTQQEPMPWRYMAPESLRRMEFNEKTDVWAFGVTLWEIYSMGDLPYEGMAWSPNFSSQLAQGLRLQQPSIKECGIYSIMLKCWNKDSAKRPTFSELKICLQ